MKHLKATEKKEWQKDTKFSAGFLKKPLIIPTYQFPESCSVP